MRASSWKLHLALLALFATAIGVLFLQEPGFGDDFTYWSFAFRLHENGLVSWYPEGFHNLRWPVWGVCWLLQVFAGPGLLSYYGEPVLYLIAGAALAFAFGRLITNSRPAAWACGIAFLFHPLLDTVNYRPMPDLSEGVWGGAAILCWWALMRAPDRRRSISSAALTGACIFVGESNRITGVFIVPILVLCTLIYGRRRFGWLIVAGAFAALFYGAEAAFYHWKFQDWLHDLHANLGNKGHKGTESIPLVKLPFRFLNALWKGGHLGQAYCVLALGGAAGAWLRHREAGSDPAAPGRREFGPAQLAQVMVIWMTALYLEYACFPQSVHPWRPLVRDADRFLCGLIIPIAVVAVLGAFWFLEMPSVRRYKAGRWPAQHPLFAGIVCVCILLFTLWRGTFNLGFVPEMRRYLGGLAPGTRVFTHKSMREFCFLVDAQSARRLEWVTEYDILHSAPYIEKEARQCDEFWYARKLVWLHARQELEKKSGEPEPALASYFDTPELNWRLVKLLAKDAETPDLIFYRRRAPTDPPPLILNPDSPQLGGLLPKLPVEWQGDVREQHASAAWAVPPDLRGKFARIEIQAACGDIETVGIWMRFQHEKAPAVLGVKHYLSGFLRLISPSAEDPATVFALKPYLHEQPFKEFFAIQIPADSDRCDIEIRLARKSKPVTFAGFRAVVE